MRNIFCAVIIIFFITSCSVSYKFNGASVDYEKTKSIQINRFTYQAPLVPFAAMESRFNEALKDVFIKNTKLKLVSQDGDMELSGEIIGYQLTPMAVQADGLAGEAKLTMTVRIRFKNYKSPSEDMEESISVFRQFNADLFNRIQEEAVKSMTDEIVQEIFNKTLSNW